MTLLIATLTLAAPVELATLLPEMADLARLTRRPIPSYSAAQASSYDRASKSPGSEAWFANGDAGKFLREEAKPGRREFVMADLKGPGAVVRIWSANPIGVMRLYFDGEPEARFAWKMPDLMSGKIDPFGDAFAYFSARGANLYFPIPYSKSLKVTVDDSMGDGVRGLYYHVGFRTYAPTANVKSLTADELAKNAGEIRATGARLVGRFEAAGKSTGRKAARPMWFQQTLFESIGKPGAIQEIRLRFAAHETTREPMDWDDPRQLHHALRKVRLVADFDGERRVDVPVPDFFSSAGGALPYRTQPMEVTEDGWMVCRFVMPFGKSARVALEQGGGPQLNVEYELKTTDEPFGNGRYLFRAQWLSDRLHSRPMKDMEFLKANGEGLFVGTSLHIGNPTSQWWGEGDEKIFVDNEDFPSTFGTGTEDYFGYAWCDPTPFTRPYHAQPRCDGPGNRGHTNVVRWQTFDPIPFRNALAFYIELWHWAEVEVDYDRVAYWYALPGTTRPAAVDTSKALLGYYPMPAPVKGATEGETLRILEKSGGETEIQSFAELSGFKQLWWRNAKEGDRLVLDVEVPEAGQYDISGHFCFARDYGRHRLMLGDQVLTSIYDFYSPDLKWQIVSFGRFPLRAGKQSLRVESLGHRAEALPANMFGFDYLMLKKVG